MASNKADSNKPVNVNERTYQEVEYLKKNLGPILVAALAEICIRRPADPIEYLGHWLLRWRYNEELKRRDVQNALDVVRQKQWAQAQEEGKPDIFSQGVTAGHPYGPPGYGGPLDAEDIGEGEPEVIETNFNNNEEGGEEYEGEDGLPQGHLKGPEYVEGEDRRLSQDAAATMNGGRNLSLGSEGQPRKTSVGPDGQPRKVSGADPNLVGPDGQRRVSQGPVAADLSALPPPYAEVGPESRKNSGPPAPESRKLSTGSTGAALAAPGAGLPQASAAGMTTLADERKTSLPTAAGSRKSSGAAPGEARKVSGDLVPDATGAEPRKPSIGNERKPSNGPAPQ